MRVAGGIVLVDSEMPNIGSMDAAKRETLRKLGTAAWVVPVVATFTLSGLNMSSAWAVGANGTFGATHS
jgi:hypothetical protein